jgi:hypothetical protein
MTKPLPVQRAVVLKKQESIIISQATSLLPATTKGSVQLNYRFILLKFIVYQT